MKSLRFNIYPTLRDSQVIDADQSDSVHTCVGNGLVGSCHGLQVLGSCAGLPGRQPSSQGRQALQEWQELCAFLHCRQLGEAVQVRRPYATVADAALLM